MLLDSYFDLTGMEQDKAYLEAVQPSITLYLIRSYPLETLENRTLYRICHS